MKKKKGWRRRRRRRRRRKRRRRRGAGNWRWWWWPSDETTFTKVARAVHAGNFMLPGLGLWLDCERYRLLIVLHQLSINQLRSINEERRAFNIITDIPSPICRHCRTPFPKFLFLILFQSDWRMNCMLGRSWLYSATSWLNAHPRDVWRDCVLEWANDEVDIFLKYSYGTKCIGYPLCRRREDSYIWHLLL